MGDHANQADNEQSRPNQDHPTTQEWRDVVSEAIAEAKAEENMHEMEGDVITIEQEIRTPRVDGLQASPNQGGEQMSMFVESIAND